MQLGPQRLAEPLDRELGGAVPGLPWEPAPPKADADRHDVPRPRMAELVQEYPTALHHIHRGEIVGYVIADAKAKDKSRRVAIGGSSDELRYDVKEYVKRLRDASKEV